MLTRRSFLGAPAGLAAGAMAGPPATSQTPIAPDVLFLLTDQWNPRCLGFAGDSAAPTPRLDRLAAEGVVFDSCYTPCPVCMPARASLLTGRYPHNHHLWGNNTDYFVPPETAPMFRDIRAAGYTTAQIGKLHWAGGPSWRKLFGSEEAYHQALGLDHCEEIATPFSTPGGSGPYQEHLRRIGRLDAYCRDIAERVEKGQYWVRPSAVEPEDHNDTFVANRALEFLERQPLDKPYCLVVSFPGPHTPMDAPGRYSKLVPPEGLPLPPNVPSQATRDGVPLDQRGLREVRANYYGKMALLDDQMGRIVDLLKRRGRWENTLAIFSADHGEMMGAHGYFSKGRFFEESARVPLVMRWPGRIAAGSRTAAPVQLFDIYPTIVEAAGGKLSGAHFARSLLPLAKGRAGSVRDAAFSEISSGARLNYMVRTPRYSWWIHQGKEALYDMRDDPYQRNNLIQAASHRGAKEEIRSVHLQYFQSTQVNLSADYRPMMDRLTEEGGGRKEGLADRLYRQYRRIQKLDGGER